jgi:hypothetical protein
MSEHSGGLVKWMWRMHNLFVRGARDVGNMIQEALDVYVDVIKLRVTQRRQESMSHPRINTEDVYLVEISGFLVIHVACL